MKYYALATDYDGTMAHDGRVDGPTLDALKKLKESGRRLLMVTGRELEDLFTTFEHPEIFDRIVAENGALVYDPATKDTKKIGLVPPREFVDELKRRGVGPISVGHVIVATWEPHQATVLDVIRKMGLELQVVFNKGAVMILPSGVNKATGLAAALADLGLSRHNVVGVGDAENDHAFLKYCGCSAAVGNALPAVRMAADVKLRGDHGTGICELVESLLADELSGFGHSAIRLGERDGGTAEFLDLVTQSALVCGTSGSGKSTLTTGLLEKLAAADWQFVIIDPEGDYDNLEFAVSLGGPQRAPLVDEVLDVLKDPSRNLTVNLLGVAVEHRPGFFGELLPRLMELRTRTGRPHCLVVDEAHHLLPVEWQPAKHVLSNRTRGLLSITVHPESLAPVIMETVDVLLAVGDAPATTVEKFCTAIGVDPPDSMRAVAKQPAGDVLVWRRGTAGATVVHTDPPKKERQRHSRKYAEGNLGAERSFYFRGPAGKLNLKAQNLTVFLQLADGVDDETWEYHLRRAEYSAWMRDFVKDAELAEAVMEVEGDRELDAAASRKALRERVEARYTLPADAPSGKVT